MPIIEIFLTGVGLSMDAFAVSVTNGMCKKGRTLAIALYCGLCFGLFQGLMPGLGFALGSAFARFIERFDHLIALLLLGYIGGNMLFESFKKEEAAAVGGTLKLSELILQGIATSIDALAVGVSFATMLPKSGMILSALMIAATTFVISAAGVFIGRRFGSVLNNKAQLVGGLILIGIGVKIFVEHTFFS